MAAAHFIAWAWVSFQAKGQPVKKANGLMTVMMVHGDEHDQENQ